MTAATMAREISMDTVLELIPGSREGLPEKTSFRCHQVVKLAEAAVEENSLRGVAAFIGNLNKTWWNDVICPAAFDGQLDAMVDDGFVALTHDWDGLPEGYIVSAAVNKNKLEVEAKFHSTQAGQDARTVCKERMDAGKSVQLSLGAAIDPDGYEYFQDGETLLTWAKGAGYDMSLFDQRGIKAHKDLCRAVFKFGPIYEFSITPIAANKKTRATMVASLDGGQSAILATTEREFEQFLRDAGYSRKAATSIALHGFKASQRDADESETIPDATEAAIVAAPSLVSAQLVHRTLSLRAACLDTSVH